MTDETDNNPARRKIVAMLGGIAGMATVGSLGMGLLNTRTAGAATILSPTLTEGPFFVDEGLARADIREDRPGAKLKLGISVTQLLSDGTLAPLPQAQVDIWHCDAEGRYSDVDNGSLNTCGQRFLRGYQRTNTKGLVRFTTIFPGWYTGRTVHIHCNIRTFDSVGNVASAHQTQLFFRESIISKVFTQEPYRARATTRDTLNRDDFIFSRLGSNRVLLFASTVIKPNRVVAAAHLVIDTNDAGRNASVSTSCG